MQLSLAAIAVLFALAIVAHCIAHLVTIYFAPLPTPYFLVCFNRGLMWKELVNVSQCLVTTVICDLLLVYMWVQGVFNSDEIEYNINTAKSACPLCD